MRITYSDHAEHKIRVRRISRRTIQTVLENPDQRFYDVATNANIAVRQIAQDRLSLVVVFTVSSTGLRVVTVYPVKDIERETGRKVNSGRWIPVSR
jgi:hypothetical protein